MKCQGCGSKMTELFTSFVCDACTPPEDVAYKKRISRPRAVNPDPPNFDNDDTEVTDFTDGPPTLKMDRPHDLCTPDPDVN